MKLYRAFPSVPWIPILQYFILFCAFSGMTYTFLRSHEERSVLWMLLVPLLIFGYEGYIRLTYTKTAGIAAAAAVAMIFWSASRRREGTFVGLAGILLAVVASMLRIKEFFGVAVVYLGLGTLFLLRTVELPRCEEKSRLLRCVAMFAALLLTVGALKLVDGAFYASDEWRYYLRYNAARTELADYGGPDYEENMEALQAMGIDEISLQGCMMDSRRFGAEQLEQIAALKRTPRITPSYLLHFGIRMAKGLPKRRSFICFVFVFICWMFVGKKGRNEQICAAVLAVLLAMLYFYLYYRGRVLKNHVDVGLWMAASLTLLAMLDGEHCERSKRGKCFAVLAVGVLAVCCWHAQWRLNADAQIATQQARRATIEAIDADSEHLYLSMGVQPSSYRAFDVWENVPAGMEDNLYRLGGWMGMTPAARSVLERFGISNLMPEIARNECILVVTKDISPLENYLRDSYGLDVEAERVKELGGFGVYRFRESGG